LAPKNVILKKSSLTCGMPASPLKGAGLRSPMAVQCLAVTTVVDAQKRIAGPLKDALKRLLCKERRTTCFCEQNANLHPTIAAHLGTLHHLSSESQTPSAGSLSTTGNLGSVAMPAERQYCVQTQATLHRQSWGRSQFGRTQLIPRLARHVSGLAHQVQCLRCFPGAAVRQQPHGIRAEPQDSKGASEPA
jgi:hypothetical protein